MKKMLERRGRPIISREDGCNAVRWGAIGGGAAMVAAIVVAHAWSAHVRAGGIADAAEVRWGSVWLWVAMTGIFWLAYEIALASCRRHDDAREQAMLERDGAP